MARKKRSAGREIGNLLLVIGLAVGLVLAAVALFAYRNARPGFYRAKNVLLSPKLLKSGAVLRDSANEPRLSRRWVFDKVEYSAAASQAYAVSPDVYEAFYILVSEERSCREPPETLAGHFPRKPVASLLMTLTPRGRLAAAYGPEQFQELQISPGGDLFRVKLPESEGHWVYFRRPGIGREVSRLFLSEGRKS